MNHATYIGPDTGWNITEGMGALIKPCEKEGLVLAQFDDFHAQRAGINQCFGWHEYDSKFFKLDESS
jgi:hypothetical protein